jgi:hypothetical protein
LVVALAVCCRARGWLLTGADEEAEAFLCFCLLFRKEGVVWPVLVPAYALFTSFGCGACITTPPLA